MRIPSEIPLLLSVLLLQTFRFSYSHDSILGRDVSFYRDTHMH